MNILRTYLESAVLRLFSSAANDLLRLPKFSINKTQVADLPYFKHKGIKKVGKNSNLMQHLIYEKEGVLIEDWHTLFFNKNQ